MQPLSSQLRDEFLALWEEYESATSPEAKVVKALYKIEVKFPQGVSNGEILKLSIVCDRVGNTSVKYHVKAFGISHHFQTEAILFETNITFVNINEVSQKQTIQR